MHYFAHLLGYLPQLSNGQLAMTAVVWIGCFLWKASAGRTPAVAQVDRCFGVKVTTGQRGSATTRTHR